MGLGTITFCYTTLYTLTPNYLFMSRLGNYLRDTASEMKHVSWPTQTQAMIYTALVISVSVLVALFVAAFDYIFTGVLNIFI